MSKIYIETPVSVKPDKEKYYGVIFFGETDHEIIGSAEYSNEFGFHAEMQDCSGITHWLRPVEAQEVPTIKDFSDWYRNRCLEKAAPPTLIESVEWMRDTLLPTIVLLKEETDSLKSTIHTDNTQVILNLEKEIASLKE